MLCQVFNHFTDLPDNNEINLFKEYGKRASILLAKQKLTTN